MDHSLERHVGRGRRATTQEETMDPMALLDMERRTGIASRDVDDFVSRMDMISEAMEQIQSGTFDPETCNIPGYKSPAQEAREAEERARKEEERRRQAEEKKQKEKTDEREYWWKRAKLRFAMERGEDADEDDANNEAASDSKTQATQWANRVLAAYKARDANDYSVWNNWVPEDPATLEEKAAREAALEKVRNEEFEKNNPEFCQQFRDDLAKRQQTQREKEREAEKSKLIGNRHYKRREYALAIDHYMKALDKSPFNVAVLTNVAQCYLRLEQLDDSVEFSTRALYVNPDHVKALSRRAAVWHRQKKWAEAAQDMERALRLDPANEDVIEQHSIVVGDYEDAIRQSQLDATLSGASATDKDIAADLRFITELVTKIDEHEKEQTEKNRPTDDEASDIIVNEAWMGYELLVPCLERRSDASDLLRTSGELLKLTQRLLSVIAPVSLRSLVDKWAREENDKSRVEELTLIAMVHVIAACLANSPRNQIVLYRDSAFRGAIMELLVGVDGFGLASLPSRLREKLLRVVEEAVDAKSWKKEVIGSRGAITALLSSVAAPVEANLSATEREAVTTSAVSASSILFTISGDDPHGLKALASDTICLKAIADGLQNHRRSTATMSNLLGVLTNLSTNHTVRKALDSGTSGLVDDALRSRLVRSLLVLVAHFTKSTLSAQKRSSYQLCAERALAALLNFSHQSESLVRRELVKHDVLTATHAILGYVSPDNISELMVIVSRSVSMLCRLHSLRAEAIETDLVASVHAGLTHRDLLDKLYKICQLSLSSFAATSTTEVSSDLWQAHAQIWCHVGWCISLPGYETSTRAYLRDKHALPAMIETLELVNAQHMYRRAASDPPTGPERIAGNVVKVLIAMLPLGEDKEKSRAFWTRKRYLAVLVDALQHVPDGPARRNVAIVLAKLCQIYGESVKSTVRELRGIEMMLTVSKSLSTKSSSSSSKAQAVAF